MRHLDDRDPDPVGIGEPHLHEPPRLAHRWPLHVDAAGRQLLVRRLDVRDLEPQPQRGRGRRCGAPGNLQEATAEKVDRAPLGAGAELPVHREPEGLSVEHP